MNISLDILHFLILLSISLLAARIFSLIGKKYFNLPEVISEIITGIIIGPFGIGMISFFGFSLIPNTENGILAPVSAGIPIPVSFYIFSQMGLIFLMFNVGLNTDVEKFVRSMGRSLTIAIFDSFISFSIGFLLMYFYTYNLLISIFIGVLITSTSTGITARILQDMEKINTKEGIIIMGSTVIIDAISITLLALITKLERNFNIIEIVYLFIEIFAFWLISLLIVMKFKKYVNNFFNIFHDRIAKFSLILLILFIFVMITDSLGLTLILGSYVFGMIISGIENKNEIIENIESVQNFFTPMFFVSVGMLMNIRIIYNDIVISIVLFLIAVFSKVLGASLPSKSLGYSRKEISIIAAGLLSMGEMGLILSNNALINGIINNEIYSSAVFATIGTTILSPIILSRIFRN